MQQRGPKLPDRSLQSLAQLGSREEKPGKRGDGVESREKKPLGQFVLYLLKPSMMLRLWRLS